MRDFTWIFQPFLLAMIDRPPPWLSEQNRLKDVHLIDNPDFPAGSFKSRQLNAI